MNVESANGEEAVSKLQAMMTESKIAAHMQEKHPGEPAIPIGQVHAMIEKTLVSI